jgi:hypothetical protein
MVFRYSCSGFTRCYWSLSSVTATARTEHRGRLIHSASCPPDRHRATHLNYQRSHPDTSSDHELRSLKMKMSLRPCIMESSQDRFRLSKASGSGRWPGSFPNHSEGTGSSFTNVVAAVRPLLKCAGLQASRRCSKRDDNKRLYFRHSTLED